MMTMMMRVVWFVLVGWLLRAASTYLESDGKAVDVQLEYTVPGQGEPVLVDGWLGLAMESANSGDYTALSIDQREYQFELPSGLSVSKGDTVYVTSADVTEHVIPDSAYSTTSGAGKVALLKATADEVSYGDNVMVTGILLPEGV